MSWDWTRITEGLPVIGPETEPASPGRECYRRTTSTDNFPLRPPALWL